MRRHIIERQDTLLTDIFCTSMKYFNLISLLLLPPALSSRCWPPVLRILPLDYRLQALVFVDHPQRIVIQVPSHPGYH
jgi:hypothetical protein